MKEIKMQNPNDHEQKAMQEMKMTVLQDESAQYFHLHTISVPADLKEIYGSDLHFIEDPKNMDIPLIYVNFVLSKEGIYNIPIPGKVGGGPISQGNRADAFGMALLRVPADAIMVGSKTLNTESTHQWHHDFIFNIFPQMKNLPHLHQTFIQWRKSLDKEHKYPPTFFMTKSGDVAIDRAAVFQNKNIETFIVTGTEGRAKIRARYPDYEKTVTINGKKIKNILEFEDDKDMMRFLRQEMNIQLLLHEGGQKVIDALARQRLITQFFLTQMNFSPTDNLDELAKAQYFFSSNNHQVPPEAKIISKRIDTTQKATLYNLDFKEVRNL